MVDADVRALYRPDVDGAAPFPHLVSGGYPDAEFLRRLASEAAASGASEVHLLAWQHPPDALAALRYHSPQLAVPVRLVVIPREAAGRQSRKPPVFREVGELLADCFSHGDGSLDVDLIRFMPGLAISPRRDPDAIIKRAAAAGFDFIDYWAVDFDYQLDGPFRHRWRWGRSPRGRRVAMRSDARWPRPPGGEARIAVKVADVFGYETVTVLTLPEPSPIPSR